MVNAIVLAAVLLNCVATVYACGGQILAQNFDQYSGGYQTWSKPMAKEDFEGLIFLKFDDFVEVGEGNLRIKNPEGCVGTSDCGATFDVQLPAMDEATLSYRFKHQEGYVLGEGGKLPGMCAMDCPAGCSDVTASSGFNARVMWRGEDLMSYVYYAGMDANENCGENWYWSTGTSPGGWNTIEMYIKVNTDGQANGKHTIKYNGAEVYSKSDVLWSQNYHPIEKFTFRSFHGGSGPEWASAQDQYIYFDDIKIFGGQCSTGDSGDDNDKLDGDKLDTSDGDDGDDMDGDVELPEITQVESTVEDTDVNKLERLSQPALLVEQGEGEPETVNQGDTTTTTEVSGTGSANAKAISSSESACATPPPPGFYCTDSGRHRKIKDRTRD